MNFPAPFFGSSVMTTVNNTVDAALTIDNSQDPTGIRTDSNVTKGAGSLPDSGDRKATYPPYVIHDTLGNALKTLQSLTPVNDTTQAILTRMSEGLKAAFGTGSGNPGASEISARISSQLIGLGDQSLTQHSDKLLQLLQK